MIGRARALAEASRFGSFVVVVATFAVVGPAVGSIAVWLVSIISKPPSDEMQVLAAAGSIILFVIFGYILGFGFALIAGVVVGAVGIWMRQNNILAAIAGALAAGIVGALAQQLFISGMWGTVPAWGAVVVCLLPTVVCWYITRGIVRATWSSAN